MQKCIRVLGVLVAGAWLGGLTQSAWAVDGTILIDQSRALAGNVTPGDTPGFPVTITLPGSYRLAGNLTVPNANTTAILIAPNTPGVTIDLNGFSIIGPTLCSGFPLACTPTGTGSGVLAQDNSSRGTTVRNGVVRGMGGIGVALYSFGGAVDGMLVMFNGSGGILIEGGLATGNRVLQNGGDGIFGGNSVITQNFVSGNRFVGIDVNDSLVTSNGLVVNGSFGLSASNTGFATNLFSSNNGSFANPQFTGRSSIGSNLCDGTVCP